jgi:glycosyltransferase involved in cell wall biosynthesis
MTATYDPRPLRLGFVMEQHVGHRTYAENLRRCLAEQSDVTTMWVPVSYAEGSRLVERLPMVPDRVRNALRGRHEARQILRHSIDATVFNTQVPAVLGGRAVQRRPYFLCYDVTPKQYDALAEGYHHRADRVGPAKWLKHRTNRSVFQRASHNFVWSTWVGRSLVDDYGVEPDRIAVLPPGVDTRLWQPRPTPHDGPLRVLFVGADFERKGGATLLEAFERLPAGSAELTLVTRAEVTPRPAVRIVNDLTANDPRLIDLYRQSDVFVLPSHAETFGIAAVEASAAGLPVIASRVGGIGDIVVDGETGFIIAPGDGRQLGQRIEQLAADADLRRRLGAAARQRAVERFDARTNAARMVEIVSRNVAARQAP